MFFTDIQQFTLPYFCENHACTTNHVPRQSDRAIFGTDVHRDIKLFTDFLIQIVDMKIQQAFVEFNTSSPDFARQKAERGYAAVTRSSGEASASVSLFCHESISRMEETGLGKLILSKLIINAAGLSGECCSFRGGMFCCTDISISFSVILSSMVRNTRLG